MVLAELKIFKEEQKPNVNSETRRRVFPSSLKRHRKKENQNLNFLSSKISLIRTKRRKKLDKTAKKQKN